MAGLQRVTGGGLPINLGGSGGGQAGWARRMPRRRGGGELVVPWGGGFNGGAAEGKGEKGGQWRENLKGRSESESRKNEDCLSLDASNPQQTRVEAAGIEEVRQEVGGGIEGTEGVGGGQGGMKNPLMRTLSPPPTASHRPIVRCLADVDCILEFAAAMLTPPDCSKCKRCINYTSHIPFVTLVANFTYGPASVLMQGLDPLPMGVASLKKEKENLERVWEQVERVPMALLLSIALRWPHPVLVPGGFDEDGSRTPLEGLGWVGGGRFWSRGGFGGGRGGEEDFWDGGEVWEEVWSWCGAAMIAWSAYVNGGSETCRGKLGGKASEVLSPEKVYDLCRRTAKD
ncbi:unnamed protein product [Closterium sp. Naga37s-1]|nr:unnamed protein product [Closterium sp. Naga37s-1]